MRHHAAELGVDLTSVDGTGAGGRVTRADVDRAAAARHRPPAAARRVSPYARRLAEELGVDLDQVVGTGPGARSAPTTCRRPPYRQRDAETPEAAPAGRRARAGRADTGRPRHARPGHATRSRR